MNPQKVQYRKLYAKSNHDIHTLSMASIFVCLCETAVSFVYNHTHVSFSSQSINFSTLKIEKWFRAKLYLIVLQLLIPVYFSIVVAILVVDIFDIHLLLYLNICLISQHGTFYSNQVKYKATNPRGKSLG